MILATSQRRFRSNLHLAYIYRCKVE